jgi:hypothetical protein
MNDAPASATLCAHARADAIERTRRHVDHCILLAVVTSQDVAATLIDQAIALCASAPQPERASAPRPEGRSAAVRPDPVLIPA